MYLSSKIKLLIFIQFPSIGILCSYKKIFALFHIANRTIQLLFPIQGFGLKRALSLNCSMLNIVGVLSSWIEYLALSRLNCKTLVAIYNSFSRAKRTELVMMPFNKALFALPDIGCLLLCFAGQASSCNAIFYWPTS